MPDRHMKCDVILELFEEHLWVIQVSGRCGIICEAVLKKKETKERRRTPEIQFPPSTSREKK